MEILDLVEKRKLKRFFRVRNKFSYAGAVYHVTQRASGAEPLFVEENDYLNMLHLVKEAAKRFSFDVFSFVLMPNHLHLLIKSNEANLSKAMKSLFEKYAKFFNLKYKRKGHVFCGPYRSALCFEDSYLFASSIYIHLNPVRARLVREPIDYRWSSCRLFLTSAERNTFINYKFILQILDEDIEKAKMKYSELLRVAARKIDQDILEHPKALELFRDRLINDFGNVLGKDKQKQWLLSDIELERRIEELSNKKRLKTPQDREARKFLIEQMRSRGFNMAEIASRLKITRGGLYRTLSIQNKQC